MWEENDLVDLDDPEDEATQLVLDPERSVLNSQSHFAEEDMVRAVQASVASNQQEHHIRLQQAMVGKRPESTIGDTFAKALSEGRTALSLAIVVKHGHPCDAWIDSAYDQGEIIQLDILSIMMRSLCSLPVSVITHLIRGDLPSAVLSDWPVRQFFESNARRGDTQPGIYIQYLADAQGLSPTVGELRRMIFLMNQYCLRSWTDLDHRRILETIERLVHPLRPGQDIASRRCFLMSEHSSFSHARKGNIDAFTAALTNRLHGMDDATRLDRVISEVGFSIGMRSQLNDDAKHRSSNYIMNLAESACMVMFPQRGIRIRQYVLRYIWRTEQVSIREIMYHRLAQAYITHGLGFSHHRAGANSSSADSVKPEDWDTWSLAQMNDVRYKRAFQAEVERPLPGTPIDTMVNEIMEKGKEMERLGTEISALLRTCDDDNEEICEYK